MVTDRYELWKVSELRFGVAVKGKSRLAKRLNERLKRYPIDYRFTDHDEPQFFFGESDREAVAKVLGIKRWPESL